MSGVRITEDNTASILEALNRLSRVDVLVGIPQSNATRNDGEALNNAEIGYLQSTGATVILNGAEVTLPPRPFLDMGIENGKARISDHLKASATSALSGDSGNAMRQLESAGLVAANSAKKVISDGDQLHPLSEVTKQMRRDAGIHGDKPLYAHGYLLRSITYVIRRK